MSEVDFVPGQRWISNTESELGLGIVVESVDRRVTLSFPAANERRVYAVDNAPLSRVIYDIGETVHSEDGVSLLISECRDDEGCVVYVGLDNDGRSVSLTELDLDSFVQFSRPLDRLFAGQIDKNKSFLLRTESLAQQHRHMQSPAYGLAGPRVQLLPHQFYIAKQVSERYHPRVLLADEVGLGKTIEAGLILHQQLLSGRAERVLIIVPDNLIHQWLVEMLRRFNLHFTILNEETCVAIEETNGDNPFESAQLILAGLSLLVDEPKRVQQAVEASWDLMVVDEAHHLSWTESVAGSAYLAIEAVAQTAAGLVLITATPEQLGIEGHFARLRLLDPDRYNSLGEFRAEEKNFRPIAELVQRLREPQMLEEFTGESELQQQLATFLGVNQVDDMASAKPEHRASLFDIAVRNLLDRHGTGRVLYRNCRDTVAGFPKRCVHAHPLPPPDEYLAQRKASSIEKLLNPERLLGESWLVLDPRVSWLDEWLHQHRNEKTLVICARARTAAALEEHLRARRGIRSAVFHENLSLVARDRAAAYFADEQENAEALVCSEIGSEGRNFQFASNLVFFDLPLNPDLLEQRIGRLDRIGQRNVIQIHVPYYERTASEVLFRWYHEGLAAFEQVFLAGSAMFDQFEQELHQRMLEPEDTEAHERLIDNTRETALATRKMLRDGRDRLLELNSYDEEEATSIIEAVHESSSRLNLADYMDDIFDFFGVEAQADGPLSLVVHPSDHMLCHNFPGLPEGGITATYDRALALTHEEVHFLTWEHPIVTGAMDMMLAGEFGNATLCALKAPFLKPGSLILEAIFLVSCVAPRHLQIPRYIPQGSIRVVVDLQNNDLSKALSAERIDGIMVETIKKRVAHQVAKRARSEINAMATRATAIAGQHLADLLVSARQNAELEQESELERLKALALVNKNIRPEEIVYGERSLKDVLTHLAKTQLKLDAVRVGLAT